MLKLQNEPDKHFPEAIRKELSMPHIYLQGLAHRKDIEDHFNAVEESEGTWSISLPAGTSFGLRGRTAERLDRPSTSVIEVSSTEPHKPEWSGRDPISQELPCRSISSDL